jgi:hypothetical protein
MERLEFLKAIGAGGLVVMAPGGLLPKAEADERFARPRAAPRRADPDHGNVVITLMDADRNAVLYTKVPRGLDQWEVDELMVTNKRPVRFPAWTSGEPCTVRHFDVRISKKHLPAPSASDAGPVPIMEGELSIPATLYNGVTPEFAPGELRLDGTIWDW